MYVVYYLNEPIGTFRKRDAALDFVVAQTNRNDVRYFAEDFEILDGSDFL
jgi:hypothetical protein